jgi:hypothetical protein
MADFDSGYTSDSAPAVLSRGMLVRLPIRGEDGRPLTCCVLGGPRGSKWGYDLVPVAVAPTQPTEPLTELYVGPEDCTPCNAPPYVLANIWNTLALVYKADTICGNKYVEAAAAYDTALEMNPGMPRVLNNYIKLCMVWADEGGDGQALMDRASDMMRELFLPISSRPEFNGLDASMGYDVVPGYEQRMVHFGVVASVDGQPARTRFSRLWVCDPESEVHDDLVEIDLVAGIPMSAEAQEAVRRGPGTLVATDSAGARVNLPAQSAGAPDEEAPSRRSCAVQ